MRKTLERCVHIRTKAAESYCIFRVRVGKIAGISLIPDGHIVLAGAFRNTAKNAKSGEVKNDCSLATLNPVFAEIIMKYILNFGLQYLFRAK